MSLIFIFIVLFLSLEKFKRRLPEKVGESLLDLRWRIQTSCFDSTNLHFGKSRHGSKIALTEIASF
jgi:hypothetical protein